MLIKTVEWREARNFTPIKFQSLILIGGSFFWKGFFVTEYLTN